MEAFTWVAGPFAQSVDGAVYPLYAGEGGGKGIGRGQVVVVVGVEVKPQFGIAAAHGPAEFKCLERVENAQRVGQHEAFDGLAPQGIDQLVDIVRGVLYAVRPVFEVEIHFQSGLPGLLNRPFDVGDVLLYCLFQLEGAVLLRALAEQVHHPGTAGAYPFDGGSVVEKSQYLYFVDVSSLPGPFAQLRGHVVFARRDAGRGNFDAGYLQVFEKQPGDTHLLLPGERDPRRLLSVPQGGIHDFDEHRQSVIDGWPPTLRLPVSC